MNRLAAALPAVFAALLAAACNTMPTQASRAAPGWDFAEVRPVTLDVSAIEVTEAYASPMQPPHIEHLAPQSPAAAVRALLARQLVAGSANGRVLHVVIEDAAMTDEPLPVTEGFRGAFLREPSNRYRGSVVLQFSLHDSSAPDIVRGNATITARRNRVVMKDASPADRDRIMEELAHDLARDVEQSVPGVVGKTFGAP